MTADPQQVYREGRGRVTALVATLDDAQMQTPVPACPAWRVHDLLCHLVGLPGDVNAGRIEGAGTDPWTAAQIAAHCDNTRDELLEEWAREAQAFEEILPMIDPPRPVFDLVVHEQDLRGAIGVPGARDSAGVRWLVFRSLAGRRSVNQIRASGCPLVYVQKVAFLPMAPADVIELV